MKTLAIDLLKASSRLAAQEAFERASDSPEELRKQRKLVNEIFDGIVVIVDKMKEKRGLRDRDDSE